MPLTDTRPGDAAKALIIHADDLGMARSINHATFDALDRGYVTSASLMVPCPWFEDAVSLARRRPAIDLGLHLTVTSEWPEHKWKPVAPRAAVGTLVGPDGCFWPDADALARAARPEEVATELRAQIDRALGAGLAPSHLDSHMFALFRTPAFHAVLREVAIEYGVPYLSPFRTGTADDPLGPDVACSIFHVAETDPALAAARCDRVAATIRRGLTQFIVHCGYDTEDLRALVGAASPFGAAWRQLDSDAVASTAFSSALARHGVTLTTWSEIAGRSKPPTLAQIDRHAHGADTRPAQRTRD